MAQETTPYAPWNVIVAPGSPAEAESLAKAGQPPRPDVSPEVIAGGIPRSPQHDLIFNGGKTIPHLTFTNLFVGGQAAWKAADIEQIDTALAAAMNDVRLNNVMAQYFPGQTLSSKFLPSRVLPGPAPAVFSQGDVEQLVSRLFSAGTLASPDLANTVFNVMLPSGAVLNTDTSVTGEMAGDYGDPADETPDCDQDEPPPTDTSNTVDSLNGLGGFHGSVHIRRAGGGQDTVYYAVGAYSEFLPNGRPNGIPVFAQPWKNVAATFYHELWEARTDADVEDAINTGDGSVTGWVSAQGEECGDFPVFEANPLTLVFQEVPLADGSGTVPVQFQYSNAVHGPEGPIDKPHPAR